MSETSSVTISTLLGYVREQRGDDGVQAVLDLAALPEDVRALTDAGHWVSYDSRIRLFEATAACFGDDQVMFEVGRSNIRQNTAPSVVLAMRALGTPEKIFRMLPRNVAKYSTTSTMTLLASGRDTATFSFVLHDGYEHSRLDCLYARGLIASVPEGFGRPAATIVHDECESDGAPACIYQVSWQRPPRLWRRARAEATAADLETAALRRQLQDLRSATADLLGDDDVDQVLGRVVERAASAVVASGYLLVVRDDDGRPRVHARGLDRARTQHLSGELLAGRSLGRSAVVVDIASSRRHHGWLAALHGAGQEALEGDLEALDGYARHAAAALDMVKALADSRRDADRAVALLDLARRLADPDRPQVIGDVVVDVLPSIVGCESAGVLLWDEQAQLLRPAASGGGTAEAQATMLGSVIDPHQTPELAALLADPQPLVLSVESASPALTALLRAIDVEHVLAMPLLSAGQLLGVITASWQTAPDTRDDDSDLMRRLLGVADQAASALRNAQLTAAVRWQAEHDELTGLPTRASLLQRLADALGPDPEDEVAVLFCDLDGFKEVNDVHGHAVGDALLRLVAARLRGCLRAGDSAGRLGGDEFAAVLTGTAGPADAQQVADRVVASFSEPFVVEGRSLRVTTSVGLALHAGPGGDPDALLRAADQAMYAAKRHGRNQVRTWSAPLAVAAQ